MFNLLKPINAMVCWYFSHVEVNRFKNMRKIRLSYHYNQSYVCSCGAAILHNAAEENLGGNYRQSNLEIPE